MEVANSCSHEEFTMTEISRFINEGLQDVFNNELLEFDDAFDELEERYDTNE